MGSFFGLLFDFLAFVTPFLAALFVFAVIYTLYYNAKVKLVRRLRYRREFSVPGAFEGGELFVVETIYNPSPLPVFFADVESYIYNSLKLLDLPGGEIDSAMQLITSRFHLMPYMEVTRRHRIRCMRRGYYRLNTACIVTRSIGVEKATYFDFEMELYVYPKIAELGAVSYPVNFIQGDSISRRRIIHDPFSVSGIRNYASGDPFNAINFKATAKSGFQGMHSIKVNKLDHCSDRIFMVYINFQTSPEITGIPTDIYESLMEQALSFAAFFVGEALCCGYKVGLAANCRTVGGARHITFPIVGGLYHIEEMLREMAKVQIGRGVSFPWLLEGAMRADVCNAEVFVMTTYIDQSMDDSLTALRMRNNAVTVVELENEEYNSFMASVGKLQKQGGEVLGL